MVYRDAGCIATRHAHVYFDSGSRDVALQFREAVAGQFGAQVDIGLPRATDRSPLAGELPDRVCA
jgi:aromatic ring-cleaving dioxygenase